MKIQKPPHEDKAFSFTRGGAPETIPDKYKVHRQLEKRLSLSMGESGHGRYRVIQEEGKMVVTVFPQEFARGKIIIVLYGSLDPEPEIIVRPGFTRHFQILPKGRPVRSERRAEIMEIIPEPYGGVRGIMDRSCVQEQGEFIKFGLPAEKGAGADILQEEDFRRGGGGVFIGRTCGPSR